MSDLRLLTPLEAGRRLGVSKTTIARMVRRGELSCVDIGHPGYPRTRIRSDELERFIEARTIAPLAESG